MQDITDLPFWRLMAQYGGPDVYFTEYFRVYSGSRLDRHILRSITENPTGGPAVAQMIGNDPAELVRTARELQQQPVAAIDLNLGCPAPVVYRKCAGGGLLREPDRIDRILGALREAVSIPFTVKTRVGFDNPEGYDQLLAILARHDLDLVTVHGRTVREMYRAPVHYDLIARAVERLPCPVLANGNVHSGRHGWEVLRETGARGLMIGRGAIRNPWIFRQFRSLAPGTADAPNAPVLPTGREVQAYIEALFEATAAPGLTAISHVQRIKKHMNFLALGVDPSGEFLHHVRRVRTQADFFALCREHLDHDRPMPLEPFELGLAPTDVLCGEHR
ncbi:MAG: tRNA-dihydrouridine synthase family protein [Verrucomicrobiales bacterium]|nr:tRNA-dihydrouridine synthase family protein [Verrucomicrobiales bacterium]